MQQMFSKAAFTKSTVDGLDAMCAVQADGVRCGCSQRLKNNNAIRTRRSILYVFPYFSNSVRPRNAPATRGMVYSNYISFPRAHRDCLHTNNVYVVEFVTSYQENRDPVKGHDDFVG